MQRNLSDEQKIKIKVEQKKINNGQLIYQSFFNILFIIIFQINFDVNKSKSSEDQAYFHS